MEIDNVGEVDGIEVAATKIIKKLEPEVEVMQYDRKRDQENSQDNGSKRTKKMLVRRSLGSCHWLQKGKASTLYTFLEKLLYVHQRFFPKLKGISKTETRQFLPR
jgi:hypothetical protein